MLFAGLLQLVESTDNKPVDNNLDNQLATSLYVDNFNRPVVNKLSRAMRTHHDIDLLHQSVAIRQQSCCNWSFAALSHRVEATCSKLVDITSFDNQPVYLNLSKIDPSGVLVDL